MATIAPFHGLRYTQNDSCRLADVVAPPYDVISPGEQDRLYGQNPRNVIRLILNKACETDCEKDNPHTRAAAFFKAWKKDGCLRKDPLPALYLSATGFTVEGRSYTRMGILARVRLEPFEKGVIRPHEKTFSKVCGERLGLMMACHANFSPIFSLFQDPDGRIFEAVSQVCGEREPDEDFTDAKGERHRLWAVTDPETTGLFCALLAPATLYIADGHHRYTTCLNYLAEKLRKNPELPENHPARHTMMYLASMDDPGLVILPAHRLLLRGGEKAAGDFLEKAPRVFDLESYPAKNPGAMLEALEKAGEGAFGVVFKGRDQVFLARLREGVMDARYSGEMPGELRDLDVTALTRLVFMDLLGLTAQDLDDATLMAYDTSALGSAARVLEGKAEAGFILNSTHIRHVRAVAEAGLTMPRKSTYFYPKVITGLVMHDLEEE
jgi:uncharacterized protein (DUF1015 family)